MTYFVSVITPTYNADKYIANAILSVKKQAYHNLEHIVVDGGSRDSTCDIVRRFNGVKLVRGHDNGMYDAINKGLKIAKGNIVGYLNADDRYYDNTISKVISCFEMRPELDFVYGGCSYIDKNEKILYSYKPIPYLNILLRNMKRICWAQPSCFWKKELHESIGYFRASLKYCGDYDFFLRLILKNLKGFRANSYFSYFMIHDESLSSQKKDEMLLEYRMIDREYEVRRNAIFSVVGEFIFKGINFYVYPRSLVLSIRSMYESIF